MGITIVPPGGTDPVGFYFRRKLFSKNRDWHDLYSEKNRIFKDHELHSLDDMRIVRPPGLVIRAYAANKDWILVLGSFDEKDFFGPDTLACSVRQGLKTVSQWEPLGETFNDLYNAGFFS